MTRQPALDGFRGIAILMVISLHLHFLRGGYIGVDIFFVLSGFLITSILLSEIRRTRNISFKRFYTHRARRLLPALVLCLFMVTAMAYYEGSLATSWPALIQTATYTTNYFPNDFVYLGHTWSLAVEGQFYLIWPVIVLLLAKLKDSRAFAILTLFMLLVAIWRIGLLYYGGNWAINRTYSGLDTRCDALIAGACVAFAARDGRQFRSQALFFSSVMVLVAIALAVRPGKLLMHAVGFSLVAVCAAYCLAYLTSNRESLAQKYLGFFALAYIGDISYGLYLFHFPIMRFSEQDLGLSPWVGLSFSVIAAVLSWHFVEKPILRRRRVKAGSDLLVKNTRADSLSHAP